MPPEHRHHKQGKHGARDQGHRKPWEKRVPAWQRTEEDGPIRLFGIHAVEAAVANPKRAIRRLLVTENAEKRLEAAIGTRGIAPERIQPRDLDRLLGADTVHQGVFLETEELPEMRLSEIAAAAIGGAPIVVLDQVTDPHNVGAILRSAAVLGSSGVVMTRRHSPRLEGALAKAASGALELVPVALVANLARAIETLKEEGVRVVGLDGDAHKVLGHGSDLAGCAVVLGAEGRGLRQLTRQSCDHLAAIAASGALRSLNVSNAAAIVLHLALMGRQRTGDPG